MSKIVDMSERIATKKQREQLERYRGRIETIQRMAQCSTCHFRCAMCGLQAKSSDPAERRPPSETFGLTFCEGCSEDFEEYLAITKGKREPNLFWHNKEWVDLWSALLGYRRAITAFVGSREFKLLVEELKSDS